MRYDIINQVKGPSFIYFAYGNRCHGSTTTSTEVQPFAIDKTNFSYEDGYERTIYQDLADGLSMEIGTTKCTRVLIVPRIILNIVSPKKYLVSELSANREVFNKKFDSTNNAPFTVMDTHNMMPKTVVRSKVNPDRHVLISNELAHDMKSAGLLNGYAIEDLIQKEIAYLESNTELCLKAEKELEEFLNVR